MTRLKHAALTAFLLTLFGLLVSPLGLDTVDAATPAPFSARYGVQLPDGSVLMGLGKTTSTASPGCTTVSGGSTCRDPAARAGDVVNVLDYQVMGDGVTDDAPKLRAIFANASGKTIYFPPARTYYLGSTGSSIYAASDPVALLISQQTYFNVVAFGATLKVAPGIALSQAVLFDRDTHFAWDGGTILGSRSGLGAGQENVAFGIFNNVDFRISPQRITGYGGVGGAFVGDFNVNGRIDTALLDGVGICFDTAFSKNLTIDVRATGADTNGASGAGQVGQKCYSNVYDVPLSPTLSFPVLTTTASAASGATSLTATATAPPIVGMGLSGTGLPSGETVSSVSSTTSNGTTTYTVGLSSATTAAVASGATETGSFASGATSISYSVYPAATTLAVGTAYPVLGTGIPAGATLTPTSAGAGMGAGTLSAATTAALASPSTITAQFNFTGFSIPDTDNVTGRIEAANFNTPVAIASGQHYKLDVNLHDNPGSGSSKGLGVYAYYNNGGIASSVGHPPKGVSVTGQAVNNGSAVAGAAVLVDASAIPSGSSDAIDGVMVGGLLCDNNASACIDAAGTAITNFVIGQNTYKGAAQTTPITAAALGLAQVMQRGASGAATITSLTSDDLYWGLYKPSTFDWRISGSTGNGNFYLYDAKNARFPFQVNPGALTNALTLTPTGAALGGVADVAKLGAVPAAPGAGLLRLFVAAGSTAGTCKLVAFAGTSTTGVTIADNIGSGC